MENYYEILEVDVHASKEVIDKAFKVLAKRYHPDTQSEDKKTWAEEKFKKINEAYEVLSNPESRKKYDIELNYDKNSAVQAILAKNEHLEKLVEQLQNELSTIKRNTPNYSNFEKTINYTSTYSNNPNPSIKYSNFNRPEQHVYYTSHSTPNRFKDFLAFLITIFCIIVIGFLLWKIPFTNKLLVQLYKENAPIRTLVNFFIA